MEKLRNNSDKLILIMLSLLGIVPSIIYIIVNKTVLGFEIYYNYFMTEKIDKTLSTTIYLVIFIFIAITYIKIIKSNGKFRNIKELLKYITVISIIFMFMLPWTSSDVFYYMGVGELDAVYKQNPYYVTMKDYYENNYEKIKDDTIFEQGTNNFWSDTTVVYGPVAQVIFKICAAVSFKNINICLLIFKIVNIVVHISNCYLIFKLTKKQKFSLIYGLNPFILFEFIAMVHNDIIIVFFILLTLYYLIKKQNIYISILFLALATGIKYFTVLLLPIVILYHFRKEEKISKRILKCIQYGLLFALLIIIEYIPYWSNIDVMFAMMPQTSRYCKSIYCTLYICFENTTIMIGVRSIFFIIFIYFYIVNCLKLLLTNENKMKYMLRKYNFVLVLFLLILSNSQQWYLIWLFATMMWQKPKVIRNIIGTSFAVEIANSVYMFKSENYIYDIYFVGIIICLLILWNIFTCKKYFKDRGNQIGKISIN